MEARKPYGMILWYVEPDGTIFIKICLLFYGRSHPFFIALRHFSGLYFFMDAWNLMNFIYLELAWKAIHLMYLLL